VTPAQVAAACGLKDPDAHVRAAETVAPSTDGRKRGYTTRMLCQAVSHASEGKEVVVVALPSYVRDETMFRLATGMAARAGLRLQRIEGQRAQFDRGSIRVASSQDPAGVPAGERPGLVVLRDHLVEATAPLYLPAKEWTCHHVVPRDGKRCASCGEDLRGQDLRDARRRRGEQEAAQREVPSRVILDPRGTAPASATYVPQKP